jgi:hypothetical protein
VVRDLLLRFIVLFCATLCYDENFHSNERNAFLMRSYTSSVQLLGSLKAAKPAFKAEEITFKTDKTSNFDPRERNGGGTDLASRPNENGEISLFSKDRGV